MAAVVRRIWLAAVLLAPVAASGAELRVGIRADPTMDPHVNYLGPNVAIARHIFDQLISFDADERIQPGLAESWRRVSALEWEFTLRDVAFSDGTPFTAEDVVFSFDRVRTLPNNPQSYVSALRSVAGVRAVDERTLRITTDVDNPTLPYQLRILSIVSRKLAAAATPGDFAAGRPTVGTGPYRFVEFRPGERLILKRNEGYWGPKPAFDGLTFRVMTNDTTRVAALLSNDVDAIDVVPPKDAERLRATPGFTVFSRESDRIIYLGLNLPPERMGWFVDKDGKELAANPFRDKRVRLAVSKAFDRRALVERGLDGLGVPAGQMVPSNFGGHDPAVAADPPDPAGARALLSEAGYPNGFGMTIHCSNGRYVNDAGVCQLLGAMLSRVGIATKVEVLPPNIYFSRMPAANPQFALMLLGWGLGSGTALSTLTDALHSYDAAKGLGSNTRGTASAELDALIEQAAGTFDEGTRVGLLRAAMAVVRRDTLVVPLYAEMTVLAARKGVIAVPRADQQTIANDWTVGP